MRGTSPSVEYSRIDTNNFFNTLEGWGNRVVSGTKRQPYNNYPGAIPTEFFVEGVEDKQGEDELIEKVREEFGVFLSCTGTFKSPVTVIGGD